MPGPPPSLVTALQHRYRFEHELGRGGMATVYLAADLQLGRQVALKVLREELGPLLGRERFLREIDIAARLQHPNILPLFESGSAGDLLYYVMPYVEGESLRERIARERQIPIEDALAITREVADALDYAHRHGVVHRDITPANILLSGGHALVADFGIARAIRAAGEASLTTPGLNPGTPLYMSPEQASAAEDLDGRSDLYSLGCVLFEMLAGEPPFTGRTPQAVIARHLGEPPPSLRVVRATVTPALQSIVEKALAKVAADRFATAAEFRDALLTTRERRAATRSRPGVRTIIGVSLLVVALVAGVGSRWLGLRADPATLDPTHVAVLFFEDLSDGARLGHVAAGLTEHLIDELSRVPGLQLISPDGVRSLRGKSVRLDSVSARFGTGTVVTGSVTESARRIRVLVRVTDPLTGVVLHSQDIERERGDLLALQDDVVQEVAQALRHGIGREIELKERRAGTRNAAAWELVRRAEALREVAMGTSDPEAAGLTLLQADSLLAAAERHDRSWTEPIVLRGWIAYDQAGLPMAGNPTIGISAGRTTTEWLRAGKEAADRALRLRPGDHAALELRGTIYYRSSWLASAQVFPEFENLLELAERDLRAATAAPSRIQPRAWSTLGVVLEVAGQYAEAANAARRAYELDAFLQNASDNVFRLYKTALELERPTEAIEWCERGIATFPRIWYFPYCRLQLSGWPLAPAASPDVAWRAFEGVRQAAAPDEWEWLRPRVEMMAATTLARLGLADSAERVLRRARASAPNDPQLHYYEAVARLRLGQRDSAVALIGASLRAAPEGRAYFRHHSLLRPLWHDPRFQALVQLETPATP